MNKQTIRVGDMVRVLPHLIYQHLTDKGVVDPPIERQHNGYSRALVTGLLDERCVEVQIGGLYDYIPQEHIEKL